jgi:diguanylate cyclase (GGDEF)-like protein
MATLKTLRPGMIDRFDRILRHRTALQLHVLCLFLVLFLGYVDFLTGPELSFSVFYLLPIGVMAWYVPSRACYIYSVFAAVVWDTSNILAGEELSLAVFYLWNGFVRLAFFLTVSTLLRRLHRLLQRERDLSRKDFCTGLLNARAFFEALAAEHSRSARKGRPLGLAFIDLDKFKKVNDEKGHAEGDRVLVMVARALQANLRRSDVIARMGGDEFAIILPECSLQDARGVAAKLVTCVSDLSAREGWPVTASVGMVVQESPAPTDDLDHFLKSSDVLMYQVKEQSRNSFLVQSYAPGELCPRTLTRA